MTTCQKLPARGCVAPFALAADNPCAPHPPSMGGRLPPAECMGLDEWSKWGFLNLTVSEWVKLNEAINDRR
jgi:hypothetical protein